MCFSFTKTHITLRWNIISLKLRKTRLQYLFFNFFMLQMLRAPIFVHSERCDCSLWHCTDDCNSNWNREFFFCLDWVWINTKLPYILRVIALVSCNSLFYQLVDSSWCWNKAAQYAADCIQAGSSWNIRTHIYYVYETWSTLTYIN